ncbi:hypothetical protein C8P63_11689 [Melghirimyces profundicolus]|uniref:Uncharacterized protein n=1 Tax=Melghirimyces profundicolus TaxID=1242148 RepID=A0A2T6BR24_9BACL|nr:hypothetical protein [Melghirimyces profundicolus]PTX58502.1 hypothetical protein C8P63_11689 [Melghirimyces profundicolus]
MSEGAVVILGEIMLRLSPPGAKRIVQAENDVERKPTSSSPCLFSVIPSVMSPDCRENALRDAVIQSFRRYGVDTRCTVRGGRRFGIYFMEPGQSLRPARVITTAGIPPWRKPHRRKPGIPIRIQSVSDHKDP